MTFIEEGFKLKMAVSSENKNHYFSFGHTLTSSLGKVSFIGELINSCICMGCIERDSFWNNKTVYVTESMYLFMPWLERGNVKKSI